MKRVAVVGAGKVGRFIARDLHWQGHEVVLIDSDVDLVASWRDQFVHVEWLAVDACELASLEPARLQECDVVIAATGDDKVNLVVSLLAKREFGVERVIARVNHPKNHWLFTDAWGVDRAVSGAHLLVALVQEAVGTGTAVELFDLDDGKATLNEVILVEGSAAVGRPLGESALPSGAVVVAVVHDGAVSAPTSTMVPVVGDRLLVLTTGRLGDDVAAALLG